MQEKKASQFLTEIFETNIERVVDSLHFPRESAIEGFIFGC
jgi:hypothetical protein